MSERIATVTEPPESEQKAADDDLGEYGKSEIAARWRVSRQEAVVSQQRTVLLRQQTEVLARIHACLTELEQIEAEEAEMDAGEGEATRPPEPEAAEDPTAALALLSAPAHI